MLIILPPGLSLRICTRGDLLGPGSEVLGCWRGEWWGAQGLDSEPRFVQRAKPAFGAWVPSPLKWAEEPWLKWGIATGVGGACSAPEGGLAGAGEGAE